MTFVDRLVNDTEDVADIASRVAAKVDRYVVALGRLTAAAVQPKDLDRPPAVKVLPPCCTATGPYLQPARLWRPSRVFGGLTINRAASCELKSPDSPGGWTNREEAGNENSSTDRLFLRQAVPGTVLLEYFYVYLY